VHRFVNDLERPVGTYLLGRRMYQTMVYWETVPTEGGSPAAQDFARIWRAADKIVYSKTLASAASGRTRIEREFDPEAVRRFKAGVERDLTVGGSRLAAQAIEADLVDEWQLFLTPVVVGGGTPWLPRNVHVELELLDQHRFASGVAYLHYRTAARVGPKA
jgi:dihydrofolate reductase